MVEGFAVCFILGFLVWRMVLKGIFENDYPQAPYVLVCLKD